MLDIGRVVTIALVAGAGTAELWEHRIVVLIIRVNRLVRGGSSVVRGHVLDVLRSRRRDLDIHYSLKKIEKMLETNECT